ncbi:MAG: DUF4157 domain-containing protein, partial [Methanoregula sp.]
MHSSVKAMNNPSLKPADAGFPQRTCSCCRRKHRFLQRVAVRSAPETAPPIVHEVLRSPGAPLDQRTREFMEMRFGQDFSQVRVHTDAKAGEAARVLDARAFTAGTDLFFATGQYAPDITVGRRLLAHELAHVVQQQQKIAGRRELIPYPVSGGNTDLLRTDPGSATTGLEVSRPGDAYEQEADLIAERVIRTEKTDLQSKRFDIDRGSVSHAGIDRFSQDTNVKYRSISRATPRILQRDLALTLPEELPDQPELTDAQVQAAIRY